MFDKCYYQLLVCCCYSQLIVIIMLLLPSALAFWRLTVLQVAWER